MKIWRKVTIAALGLGVLGILGAALYTRTPSAPNYTADEARAAAENYSARIIRDNYGVPHVFGQRDADTSFGFGYAHAEDDWATIQDTLIAARGMSAQYKGKAVAPQDYLFDLFKVAESVVKNYDAQVSPAAKDIARAYAAALNLYAVDHPNEVLPNLLPVTEQDILAGFAWATPFFYRLDGYLEELFTAEDRPNVSPWGQTSSLDLPDAVRGSNAFAVAPSRSADGHTRLIANSHQPMTGPYAWYEAHLVSDEGMNILGGTFPGVPIMAQGATPNLAWTHTVNRPDLIDIYALEVDNVDKPKQYKIDGKWTDFERTKSKFRVKLAGPFSLPVSRDVLWSKHGPVLSTPTGHYAIRFAGLGALEPGGFQIWNPPCGWLFSANATPFNITDAECNNDRTDFSETFGLEARITNRSRRALALLSPDKAISREELLRYRADTKYDPQSNLMKLVVELVSTETADEQIKQAQDILRNWDGDTTVKNRGAALAIITGTRALGYEYLEPEGDPMEMLVKTADDLMTVFGRLDPEWGEVNRIIRGDVNVPLDGAPDVLRAIYADRDGVATEGVMNAFAGDTHIIVADWDPNGQGTVDSIHNYGSATLDETSPHYNDQVELFASGGYKRVAMTLEEVLKNAAEDYEPGER